MTPKQKAKELVNKYLKSGMMIKQAKQCALICIDELKKQSRSFDYGAYISRLEWLEEVKKEIEKI